jgi:hypothetical protein
MRFFRNFPLINYDYGAEPRTVEANHDGGEHVGHVTISLRNIMLKAHILDSVLSKFEVFHPYIITEGERADTIAAEYYKDSKYTWLIYMTNNMKDPYYSWPLDYKDFISYLIKKYGSIPTAQSTIAHYKYTGLGETQEEIDRISWTMTEETYDLLGTPGTDGWTPVYAFDHEVEENDEKRNIVLIDADYVPQIRKEISRLFI